MATTTRRPTTRRPSHASRAANANAGSPAPSGSDADQLAGLLKQAGAQSQPESDSTAIAAVYALVDVETIMVPTYKAIVRVCTRQPDGSETIETVEDIHARYGHEQSAQALKCAKHIASSRGLKIGSTK